MKHLHMRVRMTVLWAREDHTDHECVNELGSEILIGNPNHPPAISLHDLHHENLGFGQTAYFRYHAVGHDPHIAEQQVDAETHIKHELFRHRGTWNDQVHLVPPNISRFRRDAGPFGHLPPPSQLLLVG